MGLKITNNKRFNSRQFEEILISLITSIHNKTTEEDILWDLAKNCIDKLNFKHCVIYLVDNSTQTLVPKAIYKPQNLKDQFQTPVAIAFGEGISGIAAMTGEAEIIADLSIDPRYIRDDEMRLSKICVPIISKEEVIVIIDSEHPEKNFYTNQHLRILKTIASICGTKIKQIRAEKKAKAEQEELLNLQKEITKLKLKVFQSQMNPHFVFNTLNAIQYFITSEEKLKALNYLSIFSKLIRNYLKNFEKETISLTDEIAMLTWYLNLQKLRYDKHFEYTLNIISNETKAVARIPGFILQTLLENIIEFLVSGNNDRSVIQINFEISEENVQVNVGFTYKNNNFIKTNYLREYRKGISKCQNQIRLLNLTSNFHGKGKATISTEVNNELTGAKVILRLPNLK